MGLFYFGRSGVSKWVFRRRVALQPCLSSFVRYATKTRGGRRGQPAMSERREVAKLGKQGFAL